MSPIRSPSYSFSANKTRSEITNIPCPARNSVPLDVTWVTVLFDHQSHPCASSLEWGGDSETWESIHSILLSRKEITEMTKYLVFQSLSCPGWNERLSRYVLNRDESPNNEEHSRWRQAKNKALKYTDTCPNQNNSFDIYYIHSHTHTKPAIYYYRHGGYISTDILLGKTDNI